MNLTAHEERLLDEHRELTERYNKLKAFLQTPGFTALKEAEATRLRWQSIFMEGYVKVLTERIHAMIRASASAQDDIEKAGNTLASVNGAILDYYRQTGRKPTRIYIGACDLMELRKLTHAYVIDSIAPPQIEVMGMQAFEVCEQHHVYVC